mgnify:CR=1 FL=1
MTVEENLSLIHISEPTRRTPISYAVFCLKKDAGAGLLVCADRQSFFNDTATTEIYT